MRPHAVAMWTRKRSQLFAMMTREHAPSHWLKLLTQPSSNHERHCDLLWYVNIAEPLLFIQITVYRYYRVGPAEFTGENNSQSIAQISKILWPSTNIDQSPDSSIWVRHNSDSPKLQVSRLQLSKLDKVSRLNHLHLHLHSYGQSYGISDNGQGSLHQVNCLKTTNRRPGGEWVGFLTYYTC